MEKFITQSKDCLFSVFILLFSTFICKGQEIEKDTTKSYKKEIKKYEGLQLKINEDWKIKFSGQINAYYVNTAQKKDLEHGVKKETFHSLRNGISQATLSFVPVHTLKDGTTITGTFGLAFGLSNSGIDSTLPQTRGFGFAPVEIRQASIRISTPKAGSLLIGRDFGLFGLDAIYYDLSIFGIGANYSYNTPKNTTLAGVGYGYIFVDKMAQLDYTTPAIFGKTSTFTLGVYDPFGTFDIYGAYGSAFSWTHNPNTLGIHGKFTFDKAFKKINIHFSSSFISQEIASSVEDSALKGLGIDTYLKLVFKGLTLSGYYYNADGIGDAGIMFGPVIKVGTEIKKIKSQGFYVQWTYAIPKSRVTLGVNYGASKVKDQVIGNSLGYSDSATRLTNSITYTINSNLVLKSEYTIQGRHKVFAPKANIFSLGGFLIF